MNRTTKKSGSASEGFSLAELTVAMFVLIVGVLGGMTMVIIGMMRNNTNRVDTTATNVAQAVIEQISNVPANTNKVVAVADCVQTDPTTSTLKINTAPGGASLKTNGDIDFLADNQATLNGNNYQLTYTVCGNNGLQTTYDVHWNVQTVGAGRWSKLVTVSARQPFVYGQTGIAYIRPVTLRTIVSM